MSEIRAPRRYAILFCESSQGDSNNLWTRDKLHIPITSAARDGANPLLPDRVLFASGETKASVGIGFSFGSRLAGQTDPHRNAIRRSLSETSGVIYGELLALALGT